MKEVGSLKLLFEVLGAQRALDLPEAVPGRHPCVRAAGEEGAEEGGVVRHQRGGGPGQAGGGRATQGLRRLRGEHHQRLHPRAADAAAKAIHDAGLHRTLRQGGAGGGGEESPQPPEIHQAYRRTGDLRPNHPTRRPRRRSRSVPPQLGTPTVREIELSDMLKTFELGAVRRDELRKNLAKSSWEMW